MTEKRLIIMSGASGSGKSTLAKQIHDDYSGDAVILSTDNFHLEPASDDYLEDKFVYVFKPEKLGYFHKQNQLNCAYEMGVGTNLIIIDNTNLTFSEMKPYVILAILFNYEIEIRIPNTSWAFDVEECTKRNSHGVPLEAIKRMLNRYESVESCMGKIEQMRKLIKEFK